MTYRLRVTARAVGDADRAYAWISEHLSPVLGMRPIGIPAQAARDGLNRAIRRMIRAKCTKGN